jgi:hypothetical protein
MCVIGDAYSLAQKEPPWAELCWEIQLVVVETLRVAAVCAGGELNHSKERAR